MSNLTHAPEPGQLVQLRNRPAIVTGVQSQGHPTGTMTLVRVDYLDGFDHPATDQVLWELESSAKQLENAGWPAIHRLDPDHPAIYDAYVNSIRWTSLQSVQSFVGEGSELPLVSPYSASIQIEDYQLTPLLRALSMPRVSLLLADDVGLGKTIQAGLITTELIIRRRIKRILIVCPASLQDQWQEEMHDKFHLDFEMMDADLVRRIEREMGSDVNPWMVHSRVITSMDYLRQEIIYQSFESNSRKRQQEIGEAFAPWDLLIVDEAHNVAPKSLIDQSLRTRMMRRLVRWFEHRLFLTATPHDGYTHSFTGLLELLDPFRFVQKDEMTDTDRRQVEAVMVRRLKREINEVSTTQRFPNRTVFGVPIRLEPREKKLFEALRLYREEAKKHLQKKGQRNDARGSFIFSLLTKRLLSSPYAFARTWWRHVGALEPVSDDQLDRSLRDADEDISDDAERDARERQALADAGAWIFRAAPLLKDPADNLSKVLREYGWTEEATAKGPAGGLDLPDAKLMALLAHVREGIAETKLDPIIGVPKKPGEERVIIFTEYKDTLDYLVAHFDKAGYKGHIIRQVFGGMPSKERKEVKKAFNTVESPIRILLATDAASEGLNLQEMCRCVCHYEIPWNPMRLEQRNGRVDRYGQARDVMVFHYTSQEEEDQAFLARVAEKVNEIREDLGSVGTVLDDGVQQHFWGGMHQEKLFELVDWVRNNDRAREDLKEIQPPGLEELQLARKRFENAQKTYLLNVPTIQNVVQSYLQLQGGRLEPSHDGYRITQARGKLKGLLQRVLANEDEALPRLVFDPAKYMKEMHGRLFYRPLPGTQLIRLAHPLTQASMGYFRRAMWGQEEKVNRWTVLGYPTKTKDYTYVELQYLITARNKLQEVVESFSSSWWFRTKPDGLDKLEKPPVMEASSPLDDEDLKKVVLELRPSVVGLNSITDPLRTDVLKAIQNRLEKDLSEAQRTAGEEIRKQHDRRMKELTRDMGEERKERLRKELIRIEERSKQLTLDPRINEERLKRLELLRQRVSDDDLAIWDENMRIVKERLDEEHLRFIKQVFPRRYSLAPNIEFVEIGVRIYVPNTRGKS